MTADYVAVLTSFYSDCASAGLHALIYSGDHDMSVPHTGSEEWVYSMQFPVTRKWDAWMDDNEQVGDVLGSWLLQTMHARDCALADTVMASTSRAV